MLTPAAPVPAEPLPVPPAQVTPVGAGIGRLRKLCSGDPYDLSGDAHLWSEFGEDERGTLYRCDICGVTDVS